MNVARPLILWIATLAAVIAAVVLLCEILLPFVGAVALAYLLDPVVTRFEAVAIECEAENDVEGQ
jgi:predicted PurR-regulated permease PerM